jgi:putative oxidoreductase
MASYGALLLRLILGVVYVMHAYLALVIRGPATTISDQIRYGVPFPEIATWYLILAHGLGGILLALGIYTRWAALVNLPAMLGALVFVHLKKGFWAFDGGYEYVLVLLVATLAAAMIGGGALSLKR